MLKKLIAAAIILLFLTSAGTAAQEIKTTRAGYVAAVSKALLDKAIEYAAAGDRVAFEKLVNGSDLIFILKGGVKVYIVDVRFDGTVKIRPAGQLGEVWTVLAAVGD